MDYFQQTTSNHTFDCQMYVSGKGLMMANLPAEAGPVRVASFMPLGYDQLVDPGFRKLLAAFESVPQSHQFVRA